MMLITKGDLIDLNVAVKQKGIGYIISKINASFKNQIHFTWDKIDNESSDWWIIPEVRRRWNFLISGDLEKEYQQYVCEKVFFQKKDLKMLSAGSGGGTPEIKFYKTGCFSLIEGFDISEKIVAHANFKAKKYDCSNLKFFQSDVHAYNFGEKKYDVILFHSSLHHFKKPEQILLKAKTALKSKGFIVIHEYIGPNRMQWKSGELKLMNYLLKNVIPEKFRYRITGSLKGKVYKPGLIRTILADPSEAVHSEEIIPALHKHFKIVEEKNIGGNILHLLLKDIAHHFTNETEEAKILLQKLFTIEDAFMKENGESDFVFGVYQKPD